LIERKQREEEEEAAAVAAFSCKIHRENGNGVSRERKRLKAYTWRIPNNNYFLIFLIKRLIYIF